MPRSKVRKRNGHAVNRPSPIRDHRPAKANMVAQRSLRLMLDEMEALLHAVPLSYDPTDIVATIGHHHHSTAVINFLRTHDVIGIIAAMGGGAMVVPEVDPLNEADAWSAAWYERHPEQRGMGTPTQEADIVQDPTLTDQPIDAHRFVGNGPGQEPTTIRGCIVCADCYQPKASPVHVVSYGAMVDAQRPAEAYSGPEDEFTPNTTGLPPYRGQVRIPGQHMHAELRAAPADEPEAFDTSTDAVERVLEGLQRGRDKRGQWEDLSGGLHDGPPDRPAPRPVPREAKCAECGQTVRTRRGTEGRGIYPHGAKVNPCPGRVAAP